MKSIQLMLVSFGMVACSSLSPVLETSGPSNLPLSSAQSMLSQAEACCESLASAPFIDVIKDGSDDYRFDNTAPAFMFSSGKSFFRAFRIPLNVSALLVEMEANIGNTVFVPTVDFYNKDMKLVKQISANEFSYKMGGAISGDILEAKFIINNLNVAPGKEFAYMIIHTTDSSLTGYTKVVHQAKQFAMAKRTEPPHIPDPLIPHAPIGVVSIKFTLESSGVDIIDKLDGPLIGDSANKSPKVMTETTGQSVVLATPGQVTTSSVAKTAAVATVAIAAEQNAGLQAVTAVESPMIQSAAAMLPETETFYNQQIQKAVASGNIEKAMALTNEAERAGSRTAKQTFVNAIKSTQK